MNSPAILPKDLIVFVADRNMQFAFKGALARPTALGIRPITFDFRTHPGRDGGVRTTGVAAVSLERTRFSHALLVLDYEGCGENQLSAVQLEEQLTEKLSSGWGTNARAVVIEPELDVWMWGADNALREVIRWPHPGSIRNWIDQRNFQLSPNGKPLRPKEALDAVMRECRMPRSSSLYQNIAGKLSLTRCEDSAFRRLNAQVRAWFPPAQDHRT